MSAELLQYPKKPHKVSDDLQSFVYIFVELGGRFHPHNLSDRRIEKLDFTSPLRLVSEINRENDRLAKFVSDFFFDKSGIAGYYTGGTKKMVDMWRGSTDIQFASGVLSKLLDDLYHCYHFSGHYRTFRRATLVFLFSSPDL